VAHALLSRSSGFGDGIVQVVGQGDSWSMKEGVIMKKIAVGMALVVALTLGSP
jgi:hypothetical protein